MRFAWIWKKRSRWLAALMLLALCTCEANCKSKPSKTEKLTALHRAALPKLVWLQAPSPNIRSAEADNATFVAQLHDAAQQNDSWMVQLLAMLELMADRDPASQNSDLQLSTWGPFDDESTPFVPDQFLLRVRSGQQVIPEDAGEEILDATTSDLFAAPAPPDFEVLYTLSRRYDGDAATEQVVLWGGTQDVQSEQPWGLLVSDFDASRAWDTQHNPVVQRLEQGRMAIAFAEVTPVDASASTQHLVATRWRSYVARNAPSQTPPVDFEQRWGHSRLDNRAIHFVTLAGPSQLDDTTAQLELVNADCAFLDDGSGRADYVARGGDIPMGFRVQGEQCWSPLGELQFASGSVLHDAGAVPPTPLEENEGDATQCTVLQPWIIPTTEQFPAELLHWFEQGTLLGAEAIVPLNAP